MQKKLIALAIAGLSGAAFAQSNVTIYGVMDMDYQSASATGGTQNAAGTLTGINQPSLGRVTSNSSLIGFKGAESLGNGMSAVFQMENYINADNNGAASMFGAQRDTYVGLTGGFGTVAAGFLSGPYRNAVVSFEMAPGATGNSAAVANIAGKALTGVGAVQSAAGAAVTGNGATLTTATRVQNTLAYITPNFSGLTGVIAYSTGPLAAESKTVDPSAAGTASVNSTAWTAGLNYDNGPLMVRAAYQSVKDAAALFASDITFNAAGEATAAPANGRSANSKVDSWILGAGYTFGSLKVNLAYDHNKASASGSAAVGALAATAAGNFRINDTVQKTWILSGKYTAGANDFILEYARARSTVDGAFGAGTAAAINFKGQNDQGANAWTLRYDYNLSKRTMLYAYWTQINNQANGAYDYTVTPIRGAIGGNGQDPKTIAAGLRHTF